MTLPALCLLLALPHSPSADPLPPPVVLRHDKSDAESRELAARFDATVRCVPDGCGTLIGSRWVLTAGHVARGLSPFWPKVVVGGEERDVRQVRLHPESQSDGMRPPRVDLALLELEEAVEGVAPVALYGQQDEEGRAVTVVGYGDFGPAGTPFTRGDGQRRAATNTVERAERGRLLLVFDEPPQGTHMEGVGGPGDSGGPLYLETDAGLFLAGVSSASMGGRPGTYGVTDVYVRVSDFRSWIETTRAESEGRVLRRREIVDVQAGFPEGERGALAAAFCAALASGEPDAVQAFGEAFRSSGSLRRNPGPAFTQRMLALREELGALTPVLVAVGDAQKWVVLARSERATWHALHLRLESEEAGVRLADFRVAPESGPPPSDGKK